MGDGKTNFHANEAGKWNIVPWFDILMDLATTNEIAGNNACWISQLNESKTNYAKGFIVLK